MTYKIEGHINTNDAAILSDAIAMNATTSVKIADVNANRMFFRVCNEGATEAIWVKLQAASVDNAKKGIVLAKKALAPNHWEMPANNIYTGEISAIADANTPNIYVTEY